MLVYWLKTIEVSQNIIEICITIKTLQFSYSSFSFGILFLSTNVSVHRYSYSVVPFYFEFCLFLSTNMYSISHVSVHGEAQEGWWRVEVTGVELIYFCVSVGVSSHRWSRERVQMDRGLWLVTRCMFITLGNCSMGRSLTQALTARSHSALMWEKVGH